MHALFANYIGAERLKGSPHQHAYWWEQEVDLDLDAATWPYGSDGPDSLVDPDGRGGAGLDG